MSCFGRDAFFSQIVMLLPTWTRNDIVCMEHHTHRELARLGSCEVYALLICHHGARLPYAVVVVASPETHTAVQDLEDLHLLLSQNRGVKRLQHASHDPGKTIVVHCTSLHTSHSEMHCES